MVVCDCFVVIGIIVVVIIVIYTVKRNSLHETNQNRQQSRTVALWCNPVATAQYVNWTFAVLWTPKDLVSTLAELVMPPTAGLEHLRGVSGRICGVDN